VVNHLVDQHPIVDVQRVFHGAGRNVEGLDDEDLEQQRENERGPDQEGQLA
jgi:hypothetical protein